MTRLILLDKSVRQINMKINDRYYEKVQPVTVLKCVKKPEQQQFKKRITV
jgi:hypothetical protein